MNAIQYNQRFALEHEALRLVGAKTGTTLWPFKSAPGTQAEADEIAAWQAANGLVADGKAGPGTWAKLRELYAPKGWLRRLPKGRAELVRVYGDISKGAPPMRKAKRRPVLFHVLVVDEFDVLLDVAISSSGYDPKSVQTYNRRKMRGPSIDPATADWSKHAYGVALDCDPPLNTWGNKPSSPLIRHPMFLAVFRALGWNIGADWKNPDTMHLEATRG